MNTHVPEKVTGLARFTPHGFELSFAVLCVFLGIGTIVADLSSTHFTSVQYLPNVLVWAWAAQLILAGGFIHTGLLWPALSIGVGLERAGLCLAFSGWATYIFMGAQAHLTPAAYFIAAFFLAAIVSRVFALSLLERAARATPSS